MSPHAHGAAPLPPTPHTPAPHLPAPHSPSPHTPSPVPASGGSTPAPLTGGKKGKRLKFPVGATLPTIAEEFDNLNSYTIDTLKAMAKKENVKALIPSSIKKNKLISILQKHHEQTTSKP